MELRELRSFCTAAKLRSISRAAGHLGLGQPTVTTHIQKLERELGMVLFDRVKRPIQLTLSGKTLSELATPLVEGIDRLAETTSLTEQQGPVGVAATHEIITHTLLNVVRAFLSNHPHIHLRIRSGVRAEVLNMVSEGEVDMGIVPGPEKSADFEFQGLFPYERVLITPPNHPLLADSPHSVDQIAKWPLIVMQRHTGSRILLEAEFRRRGIPYEIVVELDSFDMIKRYVALGMGVSVGPRLAIEPDDHNELGIVSLANLLPVEQAGIVSLRGKATSTPARRFISVVKETLGDPSEAAPRGNQVLTPTSLPVTNRRLS